ncbi:MAG: hypothetical protein M1814_005395 [Vezdaea aestivalis]|nr:MAG: hypothetical protein M1814_005395 [Vezdaea aestivalis]
MADEDSPITFNIKSSNDTKYVLTLPLSTTVIDLKTKLATSEYADIPADRQRLIYSGRVLKDADALSVYKVKDGNTIHLVKGAASNQRQNPSGQASGSTTAGGAPGNVPTNIAAGTGNNPLAGLTGARYAGHVQLPGAGLFGPDGGMGAPPDPDQMINMLSDPNVQATMNEALQNPQVIDMIMQQQPMLRNNPEMRRVFESPEFRRMMTDPQMLRQVTQMQRAMGMDGAAGGTGTGTGAFPAPGVTNTTPAAEGGAGQAPGATGGTNTTGTGMPQNLFGQGPNPFAALLGAPNAPGSPTQGTGANQQQNPTGLPPMNAAMMQQILGALGGGGGTGPGDMTYPFGALGAPPAQPPDTRPPEERYESQLRQLNDMGFYDFDRNIEALRRTGGSVQGAIEHLLSQP